MVSKYLLQSALLFRPCSCHFFSYFWIVQKKRKQKTEEYALIFELIRDPWSHSTRSKIPLLCNLKFAIWTSTNTADNATMSNKLLSSGQHNGPAAKLGSEATTESCISDYHQSKLYSSAKKLIWSRKQTDQGNQSALKSYVWKLQRKIWTLQLMLDTVHSRQYSSYSWT